MSEPWERIPLRVVWRCVNLFVPTRPSRRHFRQKMWEGWKNVQVGGEKMNVFPCSIVKISDILWPMTWLALNIPQKYVSLLLENEIR